MITRKLLTLRAGDTVKVSGPAAIEIEPIERRHSVFRATIEAPRETRIEHVRARKREQISQISG